jgi:Zn-dependent protease
LLIAVVMFQLLKVVLLFSGGGQADLAARVLLKVALLNIVLAMFNLIPIPPLDGSHLFKYLLPQELRSGYEKLGRTGVGFIILIIFINLPVVWRVFDAVLIWLVKFM